MTFPSDTVWLSKHKKTSARQFTFSELGELTRFTDDELKVVMGLLSGSDVVWELKFGSWVLLQPGRINAYAQAVMQTMRADEHDRGCLQPGRAKHNSPAFQRSSAALTGLGIFSDD